MTNIKDILASLSEAQTAMETVPALEAQLRQLQRDLEAMTERNNRLVEDNTSKDAKIGSLSANISSLEVERDQYGFRAIEAEDKLEKVSSLLGVKPVEVQQANVTPAEDTTVAQTSVTDDYRPAGEPPAFPLPETADPISVAPAMTPSVATAASTYEEKEVDVSSPFATDVSPSPSAITTAVPSPKPYLGQHSWEKPSHLTWGEFADGGGEMPGWANRYSR